MNSLKPIGELYGKKFLQVAKNSSLKLTTRHFIGHSVGSHLSSWIATVIKTNSSKKIVIPRVTGLDPSGMYIYDIFGNPKVETRLSKNSGVKS